MMVCRKEKEENVKASVICDRGFFVCVSSWKGMEGEIQMAKSVEIRWHGRGGQGAKTAALLLADVAFKTGSYVQGFPEYGPERMGAPITAYNRISQEPITIHSNIYYPDYVAVVDDSLLESIDVTHGLKKEGAVIVNTTKDKAEILPLLHGYEGRVYTIDAREISVKALGKYYPNSPMLAAVVAVSGVMEPHVFLQEMRASFQHKFAKKPEVIEGNMMALELTLESIGAVEESAKGNKTKEEKAVDKKAACQEDIAKAVSKDLDVKKEGTPKAEWEKDSAQEESVVFKVTEHSPWQDMTEGNKIFEPATSRFFCTGEWRTSTPIWEQEKCKQCLLCTPVCPDGSVPVRNGKRAEFDYDHCKGCGICAKVCPFGAITMVEGKGYSQAEQMPEEKAAKPETDKDAAGKAAKPEIDKKAAEEERKGE